jgi:hypothetical protein
LESRRRYTCDPELTRKRPCGATATVFMASVPSVKLLISAPLFTDHIFVVWSRLADTSVWLFGANATAPTVSVCPASARCLWPSADHSWRLPWAIPTAIQLPSGLTASRYGTSTVLMVRKRAPFGTVQNLTNRSCPAVIKVFPSGEKLRLARRIS